MRVPISWLRDYVDVDLSVEALAEKLTIAGLEVEGIDYYGVPGGDDKDRLVWDREKLLVGHILKVEQHPNADRLVLATVDYGGAEHEVCVTGAPNLFPYLDQGDISDQNIYSPFAMEGAEVYDGHKAGQSKMRLKGRELRGIYNRCMVCSEKELGLSEEHEGIILMRGDYAAGAPLADVLGDAVLNIDIIPNIARCASIVGVAREVAALTGKTLREPDYTLTATGPDVTGKVKITTANSELNPRFVAIVIEGISQGPSPYWMQHRLRLAGQRPINVVVDISNYVMLEMGQPNHTYDYDFLRRRADAYDPGGPIHLHTRLPEPGETLTTLDGVKHELHPFNILVTDPAGNLGLGGIMGGLDSEIADDTSNVLLEAAAWDYINVRRSTHALKINSEAGFRFSRGVHPSQALLGARRAAELMRRLAGGTVSQGIIDFYPAPPPAPVVDLTAAEVKRLSGLDLSLDEIAGLLRPLGFTVTDHELTLEVTAPDHRLDIEGSHDLVEEVCRMYGYDRLPTRIMDDVLPPQRTNVDLNKESRIKDILAQLGLQEVITYRLTTPEREGRLLAADKSLTPDVRPYLTLSNPITVDRVTMRHSLLASVLETLADNSRFRERLALFELSQVYLASEDGVLPDELRRLVLALTGPRQRDFWLDADAAPALDFFDLKGVVEALLARLNVAATRVEAAEHPSFRPGRTARLWLGDKSLGVIGELHPLVVESFEIRSDRPVLAADLDLEVLLPVIPEHNRVAAIGAYPAVREDLALLVDADLPAETVTNVLVEAGGFLLQEAALFDVYAGPNLPAGKKSLAYHLAFQAPNKTLTDKDVARQRGRILKIVGQKIGARLRE